jgi:hypothetical protein
MGRPTTGGRGALILVAIGGVGVSGHTPQSTASRKLL